MYLLIFLILFYYALKSYWLAKQDVACHILYLQFDIADISSNLNCSFRYVTYMSQYSKICNTVLSNPKRDGQSEPLFKCPDLF